MHRRWIKENEMQLDERQLQKASDGYFSAKLRFDCCHFQMEIVSDLEHNAIQSPSWVDLFLFYLF